jgi:hypothetical protein
MYRWYLLPAGERMPLKGDVTDSGKQLLRISGSNGKPTIIGSVNPQRLIVSEFLLTCDLQDMIMTWIMSSDLGGHHDS